MNQTEHKDMAATQATAPRNRWLSLIVLFALVVSLAFALMRHGDTASTVKQRKSDEWNYHTLAVTLLRDHRMESTYWSPGYTVFLAGIYSVAGPKPFAAYCVQALLFAATLFIVYHIFFYVSRRQSYALLGTGLCALWPRYHVWNARLMTESAQGFFIACCMWALIVILTRPSLWRGAVLGILMAIAVFIKPAALPVAAAAILFVALAGQDRKRSVLAAAAVALVFVAILTPWCIRNSRVAGGFVPVSTGGGYNFWIGNNPAVFRRAMTYEEVIKPMHKESMMGPLAKRDRVFFRRGLGFIREDPARALSIFAQKFSCLWLGKLGMNPAAVQARVLSFGGLTIPLEAFVSVPLFLLALYGWFALEPDARRRAYPMLGLLAIWTVVYVATAAEPRYAQPVQFYEVFLAVVGVSGLAARVLRRREPVAERGK